MAYRRTDRYKLRIKAMQKGRERARMEREPVPRWEPPDLRRRLIVEDYDSGKPQPGRLGWSRILGLLREALPRKSHALKRSRPRRSRYAEKESRWIGISACAWLWAGANA